LRKVKRHRSVHHPRCVWPQKPQAEKGNPWSAAFAIKVLRLKRDIIIRWRIASRARASPVRSAGLGWSSHTHPKLDCAMKHSEQVARCRSVERNLNSSGVRREFSRYPLHFLSGGISTVQNCAKARRSAMFRFSRLKQLTDQRWRVPLWAGAVGVVI
jgi:hypothetical protein